MRSASCRFGSTAETAVVSEPAVVDPLPGAVGADGRQAGIELRDQLGVSALRYTDGLRRLDEHVARYGDPARMEPGCNARAGLEIQRCCLGFAAHEPRETVLVVCR